jgi:hypothetical protein
MPSTYRNLPFVFFQQALTANNWNYIYGFYGTSLDVSNVVSNVSVTINSYSFANGVASITVKANAAILRTTTSPDASEGAAPSFTYNFTPNVAMNYGANTVTLYNSLSSLIVASVVNSNSNGTIVIDTTFNSTLPVSYKYQDWILSVTGTVTVSETAQTSTNVTTSNVTLIGPDATFFGMNF